MLHITQNAVSKCQEEGKRSAESLEGYMTEILSGPHEEASTSESDVSLLQPTDLIPDMVSLMTEWSFKSNICV